MYGPTEATVTAIRAEMTALPPIPGEGLPIGYPLGSHRAFIVDEALEIVAVGVPGELLLGGPCLARGYWQRADLTAQAFVPDPFSSEAGGRLYRTRRPGPPPAIGQRADPRLPGSHRFSGKNPRFFASNWVRLKPSCYSTSRWSKPSSLLTSPLPVTCNWSPMSLRPASRATAKILTDWLATNICPATWYRPFFAFLDFLPRNNSQKIDRAALPAPP